MIRKDNMIKTCCLIVTECDNYINKERYVNYLKHKLKSLILDGYHHFIAYDEPFLEFTVFQLLDIIGKELRCEINIEYVIINRHSKRWVSQMRQAQYQVVKSLINEITYINNKHDSQNIYRLCEYLAGKSDFLLCIQNAYKLSYGHKNQKIFKTFKSYDHTIDFIDPYDVFRQKDFVKECSFVKCKFNYCLFNEAYNCLLHKVEINSLGHCEKCMLVSLPEEGV